MTHFIREFNIDSFLKRFEIRKDGLIRDFFADLDFDLNGDSLDPLKLPVVRKPDIDRESNKKVYKSLYYLFFFGAKSFLTLLLDDYHHSIPAGLGPSEYDSGCQNGSDGIIAFRFEKQAR